MKAKKYILMGFLSVALGVVSSYGYTSFVKEKEIAFADDYEKVDNTVSVMSVDNALNSLPYDIKKPTKLPFTVQGSYATSEKRGNHDSIEITQVNEDTGEYITTRVINAKVIPESELYPIDTTTLSDGKSAQYMDNGAVKILYWEEDGLSYSIVYSAGDKSVKSLTNSDPSIELIKIADSFE